MNVLVTGGAGYIGSHTVHALAERGNHVVVIDSLLSGHSSSVDKRAQFVHGDIADRPLVTKVLREHRIDAIVHFAARIQVGESVRDPRLYYAGNLGATMQLCEAALDAGVNKIVFSSTAAVYGDPTTTLLEENHATKPVNPYGETKLAIEKMLSAFDAAYKFRYAALRYFNAAGANVKASLGEAHDPETHLIPIILEVALGKRSHIDIFGTDYPTKDGTCIRDFIHVIDLADAHVRALDHLYQGGESVALNLGTGVGHSVREVIVQAESETGKSITVRIGPRREGDPAVLVAAAERAKTVLGWQPSRTLREIVADAWAWHQSETCRALRAKASHG